MNHYPRHIGDWMVATAHLSMEEECVYLRMVDAYYAREAPLPLDVSAVCRLVRAAGSKAAAVVRSVLAEFFAEAPDGWHQKRCDEEIVAYREKCAKAVRSASSRWSPINANAMRTHMPSDMRTHMPTQCEGNANHEPRTKNQDKPKTLKPMSDSPEKPAPSDVISLDVPNGKPSKLASEAAEVVAFLNQKTGRYFRRTPSTLRPIMARLKEGHTVIECRAVIARKVREWSGDEKMSPYLRPATLFGAEKFAQYVGEVPPSDEAKNGE